MARTGAGLRAVRPGGWRRAGPSGTQYDSSAAARTTADGSIADLKIWFYLRTTPSLSAEGGLVPPTIASISRTLRTRTASLAVILNLSRLWVLEDRVLLDNGSVAVALGRPLRGHLATDNRFHLALAQNTHSVVRDHSQPPWYRWWPGASH